MIVSHGRRYIFVHAPKTGGTALSLALEARAMRDDILIGDTPKARQRRRRLAGLRTAGRLWKHSTLADIDGIVGAAELDGFFILMLVRNPWDRMVSLYHWLRGRRLAHPMAVLARQADFAGFAAAPLVQRSLARAPYGSYVTAADGREHCRLFARLEHLADDLAPFEAHLGFRLGRIARHNASQRGRDYRVYYDEATAAAVAHFCAADIARFGYRF